MVAEGSPLSVELAGDIAGLVGDVSGVWQWDDGTFSPAAIETEVQAGAVKIKIDYSLDDRGFFDDFARRDLLQAAADSLADRLADDLTEIRIKSPYVHWNPAHQPSLAGPGGEFVGRTI